MKHVLTRINGSLLHLAAAHDKYLSAVDPFITLKVGAVPCWPCEFRQEQLAFGRQHLRQHGQA